MTYLLDTNICSDWMREAEEFQAWANTLTANDRLITCTIVRGEILFGIDLLPLGKKRSALQQKAIELFEAVRCEPIPVNAADQYSTMKLSRHRQRLGLDENDLWIAATAASLGATLVSRDKDFVQINGLAIHPYVP